jgi:hypothetical protein
VKSHYCGVGLLLNVKVASVGGSDLCRKSLWQWVFTRIEPKRSRLKNDIGKILGEQLDAEKGAGRPVKLVRNRIAALAIGRVRFFYKKSEGLKPYSVPLRAFARKWRVRASVSSEK